MGCNSGYLMFGQTKINKNSMQHDLVYQTHSTTTQTSIAPQPSLGLAGILNELTRRTGHGNCGANMFLQCGRQMLQKWFL